MARVRSREEYECWKRSGTARPSPAGRPALVTWTARGYILLAVMTLLNGLAGPLKAA